MAILCGLQAAPPLLLLLSGCVSFSDTRCYAQKERLGAAEPFVIVTRMHAETLILFPKRRGEALSLRCTHWFEIHFLFGIALISVSHLLRFFQHVFFLLLSVKSTLLCFFPTKLALLLPNIKHVTISNFKQARHAELNITTTCCTVYSVSVACHAHALQKTKTSLCSARVFKCHRIQTSWCEPQTWLSLLQLPLHKRDCQKGELF